MVMTLSAIWPTGWANGVGIMLASLLPQLDVNAATGRGREALLEGAQRGVGDYPDATGNPRDQHEPASPGQSADAAAALPQVVIPEATAAFWYCCTACA